MDYKAISLGLERVGYREREPDPDDQRSKQILLTDRGVAAAGVIREAVGEVEAARERKLIGAGGSNGLEPSLGGLRPRR